MLRSESLKNPESVTHSSLGELRSEAGSMTRHLLFVAVLTVVALFSLFVSRSSLSNAPATSDARVSARSIRVSSHVAGKVKELSVRDGSLVRKGDLLIRIDPEIYLSVARQARMHLDAALVVRSALSGVAERSQSSFVAATEAAQLAVADAEVNASSAALELAELNLSRTVVRASVNGYVANLDVGVGDFVAEHRLTMEIVDTDSYYVHACFAESDLSRISIGAPVRIRFGPGELVVDGRVRSIDPMLTVHADPDAAYSSAAFEFPFRRHRTVRCVGADIEFDTFPVGYHPLLDAPVNVAVVVSPVEAPMSAVSGRETE